MSFRVATNNVLNKVLVYTERNYAKNVAIKFLFVTSFSSQHQNKFIASVFSKNGCQVRPKICNITTFICKVSLNILHSSKHINCDSVCSVLKLLLNDYGLYLNITSNKRVKPGFQIEKIRPLRKILDEKHKFSLCNILVF